LTETYSYLVGTHEGFDHTIKAFIALNWVVANTKNQAGVDTLPTFRSATQENTDHIWPKGSFGDELYFNLGGTREYIKSSGWGQLAYIQDVMIDIFSHDTILRDRFEKEVNRILWDIGKPDTSNRIKKSDNINNSAIAEFFEPRVAFEAPKVQDPSQRKRAHSAGILGCVYYLTRT